MNTMTNNSTNNSTSAIVNNSGILSGAVEYIEGTNITVEAGAAMLKDYMRDQRIERLSRRAPRRRVSRVAAPVQTVDDFEATTGWSYADALEMAIEAESDLRRFGTNRLYN